MNKKSIDWDFKAVSPSDYEIELVTYSDNRILLTVFNKSKKKLAEKDVKFEESLDKITKFEIDRRYLNMVKTILRPILIKIKRETKQDKIEILSIYPKHGYFTRDKFNNWQIVITFHGQYADKR